MSVLFFCFLKKESEVNRLKYEFMLTLGGGILGVGVCFLLFFFLLNFCVFLK